MSASESVEAQSAKSYALIGFIFYILGVVGSAVPLAIFGVMMMASPFNFSMPFNIGFLTLFSIGIFFVLTVAFTVWSWITMTNIEKGKYAEARTASLVLGIFGIFLAWLIGGIFLLLAYGKLGDVMERRRVSQAPPHLTGRICISCGRPIGWNAKFCEHCGKELVA